jgi:hypothetical protein
VDEDPGHATEEDSWNTHVRKRVMAWQFLCTIVKIAYADLFHQVFAIRTPSPSG